MERKEKILLIVQIFALASAILFFYLFLALDKTDCDTCSFEYKGEEVGADHIAQEFFDQCPLEGDEIPDFLPEIQKGLSQGS